MIHPIEYSSPTEISEFKLKQIKTQLEYLSEHSAFYREKFKEWKVKPADIQTWADFQSIPCTYKDDVQASNEEFFCVDGDQMAEWTTTSGTLGKPVSFGMTKADLSRLAKNEARSLAISGCQPSDRVQLMVTMDKRFMAGLAYYLGAQEFGCSTIRVGSGSPGLQLDSLTRFHPNVLIAVPSFLLKVLEYAVARKEEAGACIEKVICIGEPIRDETGAWNNLGKRLVTLLPHVQFLSTYASTEMCTALTECGQSLGAHIPADLVHVELLDANNNPVAAGEPGELSFTTLGVEGMPVLRYRSGDICISYEGACPCGNHAQRIGPVIGRKAQMLKYKGTTIFPEAVYEVMNGHSSVNDYLLVVESNELGEDDLTILFSFRHDFRPNELTMDELFESFQANLRVKPDLKELSVQAIRAMKFPAGSRKPLKLIDKRKKSI